MMLIMETGRDCFFLELPRSEWAWEGWDHRVVVRLGIHWRRLETKTESEFSPTNQMSVLLSSLLRPGDARNRSRSSLLYVSG